MNRPSSCKLETDLSGVLLSPGIKPAPKFLGETGEEGEEGEAGETGMAGMAGEAVEAGYSGATFGHLFTEWLELASSSRCPTGAGVARLKDIITTATPALLSEKDALIVIDMQQDFVPVSVNNVEGGLFGVAEGDEVVAPICSLIKAASEVGATIIATRDYHPHGVNGCVRVRV